MVYNSTSMDKLPSGLCRMVGCFNPGSDMGHIYAVEGKNMRKFQSTRWVGDRLLVG